MVSTQILRRGFRISIFLQEGLYKPLKQPNELLPNQNYPKFELTTVLKDSRDVNFIITYAS